MLLSSFKFARGPRKPVGVQGQALVLRVASVNEYACPPRNHMNDGLTKNQVTTRRARGRSARGDAHLESQIGRDPIRYKYVR